MVRHSEKERRSPRDLWYDEYNKLIMHTATCPLAEREDCEWSQPKAWVTKHKAQDSEIRHVKAVHPNYEVKVITQRG